MINNLLINKHRQIQRATAFTAALLVLVSFMVLPASAQVGSHLKYIYLSGQLTSTNTGSPIADHEIYIASDSSANGFNYYAVTKTDVNGFYRDTMATYTSDGVINIYVYDFDDNKIQLDRYYRFIDITEYLMFADFEIFDPDANEEFQANFSTEVQSQEEPLNIIFKDESIGTSIKSWSWDFGDGKTSTVQDPDHSYEEAGLYMVTLTINALPPEFHGFQTSTIVKQVKVGLREGHMLGGHVFAQYFPIHYGVAYLYKFDDQNQLIYSDTMDIDPTVGYYYFGAVPDGKYLVKARLDSNDELYGQFQPTYFRNAYNWNDAEEIVMNNADNYEGDIWLRPSSGIESGDGEILGQILYDTALYSRTPIPAEDIEILLLGTEGSFYTCNLSDNNGHFSFGDIPFGTYQLYPDVTGINTTPMYVTVSEENPQIEDLSMVIYPAEITFSINEHTSDYVDNAMLLYPNPVRDQARISLEVKKASTVDCVISDLSGRIIYNQKRYLQKGKQEMIFSVSDLPAGVYQFILVPEDKAMVSAKFLKSN